MEQMKFIRKLPEPMEVKREIPLKPEFQKLKAERDQQIADIMTGKDFSLSFAVSPEDGYSANVKLKRFA